MKIALLTEKYPPDVGGLAISCRRLAVGLTAAGLSVHVFTLTGELPPAAADVRGEEGVTVHRLGRHARTDETLSAWFRWLIASHANERFDLVHAYFAAPAGFVAVYAGRSLRLPSIVGVRGNDLDRAVFDPGKAAHVLFALQHADAITANSRDLARKAEALAPGRQALLIPNGVDAALFTPAPRDATLAEALRLGDRPVIGFVGEARAKKGLASLLDTYAQVATTRDAVLLLVGGVRGGDDKALVKAFCSSHPTLPVLVVPYLPTAQLPAYYRLLDVLVLPSVVDGLPNALLEGMACGCAIVSTPAGGIPDAIRHGENGLLAPIGDPDALADTICTLLDDRDLRHRLGAAARATVLEHFTPAQEIALNLALYAATTGCAPLNRQSSTINHQPFSIPPAAHTP